MTAIAEWAQVLAAVFAGIGLLVAAHEVRRTVAYSRSERVAAVFFKLSDNLDTKKLYYEIEYGRFQYRMDFHESPTEHHLDALLGHFDLLARQVELNILRVQDLEVLAYEFVVMYKNEEVQKYLQFLDSWCQESGNTARPFRAFRQVGARLAKGASGNLGAKSGTSGATTCAEIDVSDS